ncbi:MAG: hypothetical protein ACLU3I_08310 [Acutalibacteraceae bacterium]
MRSFEIVKDGVKLREAAELYGDRGQPVMARPSAPFTTTGIPACMWRTITIIASPVGSTET